jgi:hypothetical protein
MSSAGRGIVRIESLGPQGLTFFIVHTALDVRPAVWGSLWPRANSAMVTGWLGAWAALKRQVRPAPVC